MASLHRWYTQYSPQCLGQQVRRQTRAMLCEASSGNTYVGCCSCLFVSPELGREGDWHKSISVLRKFLRRGGGEKGRGGISVLFHFTNAGSMARAAEFNVSSGKDEAEIRIAKFEKNELGLLWPAMLLYVATTLATGN